MSAYPFLERKTRVTFPSKVAAQYSIDDMSCGCYLVQCIAVRMFSVFVQFSLEKYFQPVLTDSNFCHI